MKGHKRQLVRAVLPSLLLWVGLSVCGDGAAAVASGGEARSPDGYADDRRRRGVPDRLELHLYARAGDAGLSVYLY